MILNSPYISGSLTVTGNTNLIGSLTVTGSLAGTATSSSFAYTASSAVSAYTASSAVNATTALTASYATSFTVGGTLTAQTLVVQTITSSVSYITGSTRFGSLSTNTHTFTGSLYITGSVGIDAASSFRFNGIGDTSHAVGYDSTVDGAFLRGQNGVRFITGTGGGTERMRITTAGQVTIGNDTANSFLAFKTGGSTNYTGNITTNANTDILNLNGGAGTSYDSGSGIGLMGADRYGTKTAGVLTLFAGNAVNNTSYGFINLSTANTERMRITYSGLVGIGTQTPQYFLDVSGSSSTFSARIRNANITTDNAGLLIQAGVNAGNEILLLRNAAGTDMFTVFANGYVSSTPSAAFASGNFDIWNFLAPNQTTTGVLSFNIGKSLSTYNNAAIKFTYAGNSSTSNRLGFGFYDRDNILNITAAGNVGIGTTAPVHKIQISGSYGDSFSGNSGALVRSYATFTTSLGSTVDVFRFLKEDGTVFAQGGVSGLVYINAQDSGTGGNQISYIYTLFTTGNGTSQASLTQIYAGTLRGTNPTNGTFSIANDGGGGAVKVQTTVAGSGVSGLRCFVTFVGTAV